MRSNSSRTSGFHQLRSGCSLRKLCKKYCPVVSSRVHAGPPKLDAQLLGGPPSSDGSAHTYQSRFGLLREARASINQGCSMLVWFGTKSRMTRKSRFAASLTSASRSSSVPSAGSTSQKSETSYPQSAFGETVIGSSQIPLTPNQDR